MSVFWSLFPFSCKSFLIRTMRQKLQRQLPCRTQPLIRTRGCNLSLVVSLRIGRIQKGSKSNSFGQDLSATATLVWRKGSLSKTLDMSGNHIDLIKHPTLHKPKSTQRNHICYISPWDLRIVQYLPDFTIYKNTNTMGFHVLFQRHLTSRSFRTSHAFEDREKLEDPRQALVRLLECLAMQVHRWVLF